MELASYDERELADTNLTTPKKIFIGARMISPTHAARTRRGLFTY
jgi:hypothetical protein